jgi:hypothetical protein
MPDALFQSIAAWPDREFAQAVVVPVEQIEHRRRDLRRARRTSDGVILTLHRQA